MKPRPHRQFYDDEVVRFGYAGRHKTSNIDKLNNFGHMNRGEKQPKRFSDVSYRKMMKVESKRRQGIFGRDTFTKCAKDEFHEITQDMDEAHGQNDAKHGKDRIKQLDKLDKSHTPQMIPVEGEDNDLIRCGEPTNDKPTQQPKPLYKPTKKKVDISGYRNLSQMSKNIVSI